MRQLSHESLIEYLIEESYEVVEAIEAGKTPAELRGELGDVLLQVVLHARIAEESGQFVIDDVVRGLTEKMTRRNAHVFKPDGSLQEHFPASIDEIITKWNQAKALENPQRSRFEGIPASLPALALAQKTLRRDKVARSPSQLAEEELGEQLLELVRSNPDVDAERALRMAVRRFQGEHDG
nr:MazG nucleotide pyrophosphohydrolase domain-containing protein [Renibacterium salmoninarum]